jgi:hypothetical protein
MFNIEEISVFVTVQQVDSDALHLDADVLLLKFNNSEAKIPTKLRNTKSGSRKLCICRQSKRVFVLYVPFGLTNAKCSNIADFHATCNLTN